MKQAEIDARIEIKQAPDKKFDDQSSGGGKTRARIFLFLTAVRKSLSGKVPPGIRLPHPVVLAHPAGPPAMPGSDRARSFPGGGNRIGSLAAARIRL